MASTESVTHRNEESELFEISIKGPPSTVPSYPVVEKKNKKKNKLKAGGQADSLLMEPKLSEMLRPNLTFQSNGKPVRPYMMAADHSMDDLRTLLWAKKKARD